MKYIFDQRVDLFCRKGSSNMLSACELVGAGRELNSVTRCHGHGYKSSRWRVA